MGQADYFKPRDFNRICDRCGSKVKASQTFRERRGWIVCADCHDGYQRREVMRTLAQRTVPEPRPDCGPVFVVPGEITPDSL